MYTTKLSQELMRALETLSRSKATAIFLAILILGFAAMTRICLVNTWQCNASPGSDVVDRQKELIAAQTDLSKWLLGLSSGALISLIALRLKDPGDERLIETLPMASYALLVLSLYGAFLVNDSTIKILTQGPISCLYGDRFRFPLLAQFWTLVSGMTILGIWLLRPRRPQVLIGAFALLFLVAKPVPAAENRRECAEKWFQEKHLQAQTDDLTRIEAIITGIEKRSKMTLPANCPATESFLDEIASGQNETDRIHETLRDLNDQLSHPNASEATLVAKLVKWMDITRVEYGTLRIIFTRKEDLLLFVDGNPRGSVPRVVLLPPGPHNVKLVLVEGSKTILSKDALQIADGSEKIVNADEAMHP